VVLVPPENVTFNRKDRFRENHMFESELLQIVEDYPQHFFRNCTDVRSLREYCMKLPECCTISDCDPPPKK